MALSDYQMSFGGLTIGAGTVYPIQEITDLEAFDVRSSDIDVPNGWGSYPGPAYVAERTIVLTVLALGGAPVVHTIEAAFVPQAATPDALSALGVKLPDREELTMQARCDRRSRALNTQSEYGIVPITVALTVPNPRKYAAALSNSAVGVFQGALGGVELDVGATSSLGFELNVGSGADMGIDLSASTLTDYTVINAGNTITYPVLTFSSSAGISLYRLTNRTNGDVITLSQALGATDTLTADMGAVVSGVGTPILVSGVSTYSAWQVPRRLFRLSPGNNVLRFEVLTGSSTANCNVAWRNAYI